MEKFKSNFKYMVKYRIAFTALFVLILLATALPFVTIFRYNGQAILKSLNLYQCGTVVASVNSVSRTAILRIPEMGQAALTLAGFTYFYAPIIALAGLLMTLFLKRFSFGDTVVGFVGLLLVASEAVSLKMQLGGENLNIGVAPFVIGGLLLVVGVMGAVLHRSEPREENVRSTNIQNLMRKYGLVVVIVFMMVELSILSNVFLSSENLIDVLRQVSINGILAMGMTLVIITAGIDLTVGSLVAVSGVIIGSIITHNASLSILSIFVAIAVCAAFGAFNGFSIAKFGIPPMIATLAMMTIARGFALAYSNGRPYIITARQFAFLGKGDVLGIPVPVIVLVVIVVLTFLILNKSKLGRYIYAIGGNEQAARVSGVSVNSVKIFVYTYMGALSGLAGAVLASRISSGQPAVGTGYEMDAIAAAAIGGTSLMGGVGTIFGSILGFLIIGLIANGLTLLGVSSYYQQIVKGLIILAAVLLDIRSKGKQN